MGRIWFGRQIIFIVCLILFTISFSFPRSFATAPAISHTAPTQISRVTYHQGLILSNSFLFVVFWGTDWLQPPSLVQQIYSGLHDVMESGYLDALDQYGYGNLQLNGYTVNEVVLPSNTLLKEEEILNFAAGMLSSGFVPKYNSQILFILPPRPDVRMENYLGLQASNYHSFMYSDPWDFKSILAYSIVKPSSSLEDLRFLPAIYSEILLGGTREIVDAITNPTGRGWYAPSMAFSGEISNLYPCNSGALLTPRNFINGIPVSSYWSEVDGKCVIGGGTGLSVFVLDISGLPSGYCAKVEWSSNLQTFRMPVCDSTRWILRATLNSTVKLSLTIIQVDEHKRFSLAPADGEWTLTSSGPITVTAQYEEHGSGPEGSFQLLIFSATAISIFVGVVIFRRFRTRPSVNVE